MRIVKRSAYSFMSEIYIYSLLQGIERKLFA
jgi:hypothetical protein